jgi:hypothetical protein
VNDEFRKMWKKSGVVLSYYLLEVTKENHENLSQDTLPPGRDLNPGHPEYGDICFKP